MFLRMSVLDLSIRRTKESHDDTSSGFVPFQGGSQLGMIRVQVSVDLARQLGAQTTPVSPFQEGRN